MKTQIMGLRLKTALKAGLKVCQANDPETGACADNNHNQVAGLR